MKLSITSIIASAFVAVIMCAGCEPKPVTAQPKEAGKSAVSGIDPQAQAVLKSMSEMLDGAKSFSCTVHQMYDAPSASGQLVQYTRKSEVTVVRPDRMAVTTTGYDFERKLFHDGRLLTIVDVKGNIYAKDEKSPEKIGDMLDFLADKYHLVMPLADLMFPQSYKAMTADVTSGQYLGVHRCGKHECHHLAFTQPNIDWQIWIDTGDKPLLRKMMIIYKTQSGMPRYTSVIRNWELSPKIAKDAFAPQIPAGANLITLDKMFNIENAL